MTWEEEHSRRDKKKKKMLAQGRTAPEPLQKRGKQACAGGFSSFGDKKLNEEKGGGGWRITQRILNWKERMEQMGFIWRSASLCKKQVNDRSTLLAYSATDSITGQEEE